MSGFSAEWLALREPADHAARNAPLAQAAADLLAGRAPARILDLACGTGSNLRGFCPLVTGPQQWTLVDFDAGLLAAARALFPPRGKGGAYLATIAVTFQQADLTRDLENMLDAPCDLVTAAAFFDLVSPRYIQQFCAALATRRLPLYAVLTYDGVGHWHPAHPLDAEILGAFHAHQATDKGFGPAAGPRAHGLLCAGLKARGYTIHEAASPWRLDIASRALMDQLAQGIADAAQATGRVSAADAARWRHARQTACACETGHMDVLAVPG